jgi:hypothetical protein
MSECPLLDVLVKGQLRATQKVGQHVVNARAMLGANV